MTERMDDFRKDAMAVVMKELAAGDDNQIGLYILHALRTKYQVIKEKDPARTPLDIALQNNRFLLLN